LLQELLDNLNWSIEGCIDCQKNAPLMPYILEAKWRNIRASTRACVSPSHFWNDLAASDNQSHILALARAGQSRADA